MTPIQKIIKYCAIAFGLYLVMSIVWGIVTAIAAIFGISYISSTSNKEKTNFSQSYSSIENINVELGNSKLNILKGDEFKVVANNVNKDFVCSMDNSTLRIKDNKDSVLFFNVSKKPEITIYVPDNYKLKSFDLESGVNDLNIDYLNSDSVKINFGVGKSVISNLTANTANFSGGAGKSVISNAVINSLKLDSGVGSFDITAKVLENAKIDSGVGSLNVNLIGTQYNYRVETSTGLGSMFVNGQKASDDSTYGTGLVDVKVDGGTGSTRVNFISK